MEEVVGVLNWTYYPPLARVLALVLLAPVVLAVAGLIVWARAVGPDVAIPAVIAVVVGLPLSIALVRARMAAIEELSEWVESRKGGSHTRGRL
jgi:hypothetical protein